MFDSGITDFASTKLVEPIPEVESPTLYAITDTS